MNSSTESGLSTAESAQVARVLSVRDAKWVLRRCGRKGHVVANISDPINDLLVATDPAGQQLLRCIRCGTFVAQDDPAIGVRAGTSEAPIELANTPLPLRGSHGRKLALLRALAVERGLRAMGLYLAAIAAFELASNHDIALQKFQELVTSAGPLATQLGFDIEHFELLGKAESLLKHNADIYIWISLGLIVYASVQIVEAAGLWKGKRWAEYLTVVATTMFIPLELYEVVHHPTSFKICLLLINIAAVIYLLYKGRLFGIRGGYPAMLREVRDSTFLADQLTATGRNPEVLTSTTLL